MEKSNEQDIKKRLIQKQIYEREMDKRRKLDIFNYSELSEDMELYTEEYPINAFYGNYRAVRKYLQCTDKIMGSIEHGPAFDSAIWDMDLNNQYAMIYTFSNARKDLIETKYPNMRAVAIGPYIQYVDGIYSSDEIKHIKSSLGKVLLVFPSHSTHYVSADYDFALFIAEIERIRFIGKFDHVLVCMYWRDINLKKHLCYEQKNYKIVTAGHIFDYLFLDRLKSIISIADVTMSNVLGTHIGYCVCQGKPHYFYQQRVESKGTDPSRMCGQLDGEEKKLFYESLNRRFSQVLGRYKEELEAQDIELVKEFWGKW